MAIPPNLLVFICTLIIYTLYGEKKYLIRLIEKLTSVLAQAIATARVISVFALEFSS